jgi:hypothetical protein
MAQFGLVFALVALSIVGLALGVLLGRAPLQGGCGSGRCVKLTKCTGCPHSTQKKDT